MNGRGPSTIVGLVLAIVLLAGTAALSRVPYAAEREDTALLRLSWRYQRPADADCRRPTAAELAELPVHMRNPDACIQTPTPYRVTATVDGRTVVDDTLEAAGARRDRPVFVYVDVPLTAARHTLGVTFTSIEEDVTPSQVTLSWQETLDVEAHRIVLVQYDRDTRALVRAVPLDGPETP